MDYHKDRFIDYSLMVYNDKNSLIACFPANITKDNVIWSHQGLTYGSIITETDAKLIMTLSIFQIILKYLKDEGISSIIYKDFPKFYNNGPSEETEYALFQVEAKLIRRDTAIVIDQRNPLKYQNRRKRSIKSAAKQGVKIDAVEDIKRFWEEILSPNLQERFGVNPVHSLSEINLLKEHFPKNIILKTASLNGEMMAGVLLFITDQVVHAQYISASNEGRSNGSLDFLFDQVITKYKDIHYFDFGICNENNGKELNEGLLSWKEGFGGRTFSHNFYEINTSRTENLLNVLNLNNV
jgi:hypothetical protein